ncbi:Cytochrome c domain-containing protein [Planctomycetales bacterium 10988]|nr:Cytochrome c domain-containing protein [Planctomycetales bacterium 10988]
MSESETTAPSTDTSSEELVYLLAEFKKPAQVLHAAEKVRDAGYQKWDVHTPFPIHGIDEAMGIKRTIIPWIVFGAAVVSGLTAFGLQYMTNVEFYPFMISGKPINSIPSNMPVIFELTVLGSALTAFATMILLNKLPRLSNPLLRNERFRRATADRFFITIDAKDPKFQAEGTLEFLKELDPSHIESIYEDYSTAKMPGFFFWASLIAVILLLIPPSIVLYMRATPSKTPKYHLIFDMDFQPKFKAQTVSTLFPDYRAMRPDVPGTIARGELELDDRFYRGVEPGGNNQVAQSESASQGPFQTVAFQEGAESQEEGGSESEESDSEESTNESQPSEDSSEESSESGDAEEGSSEEGGEEQASAQDPGQDVPWVTSFPIEVNEEVMLRGQEKFRVYCSVCHGLDGYSDGPVTHRAMELEQGTWTKPVSFHSDHVMKQPVGRLFNTVTNGQGKMPGYRDQIPPEDRWAIVLYLKALQRAQAASLEDVPEDVRDTLRELR